VSSSGVVRTAANPRCPDASAPPRRARGSEPPLRDLTPYRARLDVDMDDTAVSRVRDPSASLRIGPEGELIELPPAVSLDPPAKGEATPPATGLYGLHQGPLSLLLGAAFGVLIVLLAVLAARCF
jgi:hypothetical protein